MNASQLVAGSQLQVVGSKLCSLLFGEKICGSKFWQIFRRLSFAYDKTVTIPSRLIFAFAIFALHISNITERRTLYKITKTPNKPCS